MPKGPEEAKELFEFLAHGLDRIDPDELAGVKPLHFLNFGESLKPAGILEAADPLKPDKAIDPYLPSLSDALQAWKDGDDSKLLGRSLAMEKAHMTPLVIVCLYGWLTAAQKPFLLLEHEALVTQEEKAEYLASQQVIVSDYFGTKESITPVRTVTLSFHDGEDRKRGLVTALSNDPFVDKGVKRDIAQKLGLPSKATKNAIINDKEIDPLVIFGGMPGIISPFINPFHAPLLDGLYYLQNDLPAATPAEIAVSYNDSLVVRKDDFEGLLGNFAKYVLRKKGITTLQNLSASN